jgi:hypothetical protein
MCCSFWGRNPTLLRSHSRTQFKFHQSNLVQAKMVFGCLKEQLGTSTRKPETQSHHHSPKPEMFLSPLPRPGSPCQPMLKLYSVLVVFQLQSHAKEVP